MDPVPQNVPLVACVPAQPMNKQTGFAFGLLQALRKLGGQEGSHCLSENIAAKNVYQLCWHHPMQLVVMS